MVLGNAAHAFKKPNILDIKLGNILYEEDATEDKKQRMIKQAESTTSAATGLRLTGFQVSSSGSLILIVIEQLGGVGL